MFVPPIHTPETCICTEEAGRKHDAVIGRLLTPQALCLSRQNVVLLEHEWLLPVRVDGCDAGEYFLSHEVSLRVYLRDPGFLYDVNCRADSCDDDDGW